MSILEKSSEQISVLERLHVWSEETVNKSLMGAHASSVSKKIRNSLFLANNVRSATSHKPTVGIYGPSQAGKSYLSAKFAENERGILKVKLGSEFDFLQDINPPGGRESTALVSRFTTDIEQVDVSFPIKADTLSETDIICILANSYFCDNSHAEYPEVADIEHTLNVYDCGGNSFDISKDSDAYRLEHYLVKKILPKDVSERFTPLWNKAVVVKQIKSLHERAGVYSLLWNRNEQFTNLFIKLSSSLQELGDETQIHLSISSLTPRSTSIIDVSILEHLDGKKSDVEVVKTQTKEVSIEKSVLSALISELYLPIVDPKRKVFEKADLLDFPGARTRFQKHLQDNDEHGIHEFFLRGKIDYLFHKFTMDRRLDALVFCIDPGPLNVRELPDSLDDWLQLNRNDQSNFGDNLFFTLTKFDTHFPDAAGNQTDESQRFENALDSGLIQPFARESTSWPLNWNGYPFTNVFPIRNPNYPLHGYFEYEGGTEVAKSERMENRILELRRGYLDSNLVSAHIGNADEKWDDLVRVNGGGAEYLAKQIDILNLPALKYENLLGTLNTTAKSAGEMLSMFVQSGNGEERLDLEKHKFRELLKPIYGIGQSGKFSSLLKYVGVDEQLLKTSLYSAVLNGSRETVVSPETVDLDGWQPDILSDDQITDSKNAAVTPNAAYSAQNLADKILGTWLNSLSGTTSVSKIAQDLNTSVDAYEFLISHLAHETQIEQLKIRISFRLEQWAYGMTLNSNLGAAAKIASDEINSHVCMRAPPVIDEVFENLNVNTFRIAELESSITKWQNWINEFGELISKNCKVRTSSNFDANQNSILMDNVQQLTPV
jgi:hypothetical protein